MGNRKEAREGDVEGGWKGGSGRDGTWGPRGNQSGQQMNVEGEYPEPCWRNSRTNTVHVMVSVTTMIMTMVMMMLMLVILTALIMTMLMGVYKTMLA